MNRRGVRGGAWNDNRLNARVAYRNANDPHNRNNEVGWRLACLSHTFKPLPRRGAIKQRRCEHTHRLSRHGWRFQ